MVTIAPNVNHYMLLDVMHTIMLLIATNVSNCVSCKCNSSYNHHIVMCDRWSCSMHGSLRFDACTTYRRCSVMQTVGQSSLLNLQVTSSGTA